MRHGLVPEWLSERPEPQLGGQFGENLENDLANDVEQELE